MELKPHLGAGHGTRVEPYVSASQARAHQRTNTKQAHKRARSHTHLDRRVGWSAIIANRIAPVATLCASSICFSTFSGESSVNSNVERRWRL